MSDRATKRNRHPPLWVVKFKQYPRQPGHIVCVSTYQARTLDQALALHTANFPRSVVHLIINKAHLHLLGQPE